jgi:hypothetical protein
MGSTKRGTQSHGYASVIIHSGRNRVGACPSFQSNISTMVLTLKDKSITYASNLDNNSVIISYRYLKFQDNPLLFLNRIRTAFGQSIYHCGNPNCSKFVLG